MARIGLAEAPADRYEDISTWNSAVHAALTGPFSPTAISTGRFEDTQPVWARPTLAAVTGLSIGFIIAAVLWFDGAKTTIMPNILGAITSTTSSTSSTTTPPVLPSVASSQPEGPTQPPVTAGSSRPVPPTPTVDGGKASSDSDAPPSGEATDVILDPLTMVADCSVTPITWTYVSPEGEIIFDYPHKCRAVELIRGSRATQAEG